MYGASFQQFAIWSKSDQVRKCKVRTPISNILTYDYRNIFFSYSLTKSGMLSACLDIFKNMIKTFFVKIQNSVNIFLSELI